MDSTRIATPVAQGKGLERGGSGIPPTVWAPLAAVAGLIVALHAETIQALVERWSDDPDYGHGFLVPCVSGYLLYQLGWPGGLEARPSLGTRFLGTAILSLGLAATFLERLLPSTVIGALAMLVCLGGASLLALGWRELRPRLPAILFLLFMIPLPSSVHVKISFPLQLMISRIATGALNAAGVPALCEGNMIHLPSHTLHVAEACSGVRQLTAFLALGALAAMLLNRPWWVRVLILLSAGPIAVAANTIRVVTNGFLAHWGIDWFAEGFMHSAEGLALVAGALAVFAAELWILDLLASPGTGVVATSVAVDEAPRRHES